MIPLNFHVRSIDDNAMNEGAVYIPTIVSVAGGRHITSLVPKQTNLFHLDRATVPLRPLTQSEREIPIRQATPERDQYHLHLLAIIVPRHRLHSAAQVHRHSHTRISLHHPPKQLSVSSSSSGGAWNYAGSLAQMVAVAGRCCLERLLAMQAWM